MGLNSYFDQMSIAEGYSEYLVHFGVSGIHFGNVGKAFKETGTGTSQGYKHNIQLIFAEPQNGVWSYPLHCSPAHYVSSYTFRYTSHAHFCLPPYPSHSLWYITVLPALFYTYYPTPYSSHSSCEHTSCCHIPPPIFQAHIACCHSLHNSLVQI